MRRSYSICSGVDDGTLEIRNATLHNLRDVNVDIPLGVLCVVTGVGVGAGVVDWKALFAAAKTAGLQVHRIDLAKARSKNQLLDAFAQDVVKTFRDGGFEPEGYTLSMYAAIQVWAAAATEARKMSSVRMASLKPSPVRPSWWLFGTRQAAKRRRASERSQAA